MIDVRTPGEYACGHLPGAHNIPLAHLSSAVPALQQVANRTQPSELRATLNALTRQRRGSASPPTVVVDGEPEEVGRTRDARVVVAYDAFTEMGQLGVGGRSFTQTSRCRGMQVRLDRALVL